MSQMGPANFRQLAQRNKEQDDSSFQESADSPMMEAPDSPPADTTPNSQPAAASTTATFSSSVAQAANSNTNYKSVAGTSGKHKVDFGAPGSAWSGKKHLDEYTRAMTSLVDRDTDAHCKFISTFFFRDRAKLFTARYGDVLQPKNSQ